MTDEPITINRQQAAIIYTAIATAAELAEVASKLKSAAKHRGAFAIQIAAYRGEMARLSAAFPELTATR